MNEETKKMAELLRQGNKMLNQSCPECNNPLFEDPNEKIFCPVCNREVIIVENEEEYNKIKEKGQKSSLDKRVKKEDQNLVLKNIQKVILDKIEFLSDHLKTENQIENIEKYTNTLEKLVDLYQKIEFQENNK